jgi:hypothetical protein
VVPKAIFYKKRLERLFYDTYFRKAAWYREVDKIEAAAQIEAANAGLGEMDALHLAAAHLSQADEFVTTEKSNKSIYKSSLVKVVTCLRSPTHRARLRARVCPSVAKS